MNVVLDTSVVLRVVLADSARLEQWGDWDQAYGSELLSVESSRRLFNLRTEGAYDDDLLESALSRLRDILGNLTLLKLTEPVLRRASGHLPTVVGTLDALHLSTALALGELGVDDLVFATHDERQGRAARALGLPVIGLPDSP